MSTEKPKDEVTSKDGQEKELDEDELERVSGGVGITADIGGVKGVKLQQKVLDSKILDSSLSTTMDPSKMGTVKLTKY